MVSKTSKPGSTPCLFLEFVHVRGREAMAIKNYYVVLGVPPSESASGIRAAFRELAKRYHGQLALERRKEALWRSHEGGAWCIWQLKPEPPPSP
jgi:hypothetical protein